MTISMTMFLSFVAVGVVGVLYLAQRLHKETMGFVSELQFFLKHRTLEHNKVKAQLSVLKTRFAKMEKENIELKAQLQTPNQDTSSFSGLLAESEFIEAQKGEIEKLGMEISSIQEVLDRDFKQKLSTYLAEVDGLSERLGKAKDEFSNKLAKTSLAKLDSKNIL